MLDAVVLWNTTCLGAAVDQLRGQGPPVSDEDAARLHPLGDRHLNVRGAYSFDQPPSTELRPLRDPSEHAAAIDEP